MRSEFGALDWENPTRLSGVLGPGVPWCVGAFGITKMIAHTAPQSSCKGRSNAALVVTFSQRGAAALLPR
jgi:hypothetical protein